MDVVNRLRRYEVATLLEQVLLTRSGLPLVHAPDRSSFREWYILMIDKPSSPERSLLSNSQDI